MRALELRQELQKQIGLLGKAQLNYMYGQLHNLLNGEKNLDDWAQLSEEHKEGIYQAIDQKNENKLFSNNQVMDGVKKKYGLS
jgi:hypothetical protein